MGGEGSDVLSAADIRHYAVAIEALSRVPGDSIEELRLRIVRLMETDITKQEDYNKQHKPTRTSLDEDEIPF